MGIAGTWVMKGRGPTTAESSTAYPAAAAHTYALPSMYIDLSLSRHAVTAVLQVAKGVGSHVKPVAARQYCILQSS